MQEVTLRKKRNKAPPGLVQLVETEKQKKTDGEKELKDFLGSVLVSSGGKSSVAG